MTGAHATTEQAYDFGAGREERRLCAECGVDLLGHEPMHPEHWVCDMCLEVMLATGEIER